VATVGDTICRNQQDQLVPAILSDTNGNAYIVWQDHRNLDIDPTHYMADLYGQRVNDTTGKPIWTAGGIQLVSQKNDQYDQQLLPDGTNGFYMAWLDNRIAANNTDIYMMRVTDAGTKLWAGANGAGLAVTIANGIQDQVHMTRVATGAMVTWHDSRTAGDIGGDLYGQMVFANGTLPVEISSFTANATAAADVVHVSWTTAAEINTVGFELFRQRDEGDFIRIAGYTDIASLNARGNASIGASYDFIDSHAGGTSCSYKLVAVDNDGSRKEFGPVIVHLSAPTTMSIEQNYPNPFSSTTVMGYSLPGQSDVVIRVADMLGRTVSTSVHPAQNAGWHTCTIDGSTLAPGSYFVMIESAGTTVRRRISIAR